MRRIGVTCLAAILMIGAAGAAWGETKAQKAADQKLSAAQKAADDANANAAAAAKDLSDAIDDRQANFQRSKPYKDAQVAITKAAADQAKARDAVLAKLKTSPAYQEASAKETAANTQLLTLKNKGASAAEIDAAQQAEFRVSGIVTKLENDALAADPDYTAAKQKVLDANSALQDLKDTYVSGLAADPAIVKLKHAKEVADQKAKSAEDKVAQAQRNDTTAHK